MESKHTPGPWRIDYNAPTHEENIYYDIQAGIGASSDGFTVNGFISQANANLIVAAPELLEALRNLLKSAPSIEEIGTTTFDNHLVKSIRGAEFAINKALGNS